jgi:hypothetical protein
LEEPEDEPPMRRFWVGSEDIAEYGDGIVIGEGVWLNETGTRYIVEEELVDDVRISSWLR